MLKIEVVTLFPEMVRTALGFGIVSRAIARGLVSVGTEDPRTYATDVHRTVDDRPYGGGPGMVMKIEPLRSAIRAARGRCPEGSRTILMSAQGAVLDQAKLKALATTPGFVLVAGRYEGVDERLIEMEIDEEVSIGDYVLSGGELPALVAIDAVTRLLPGALGDENSAQQDSFAAGLLDWPHYTRPEEFEGCRVPEVLLSGDHAAIRRWRLKQALGRTWQRRGELIRCLESNGELNDEWRQLLDEFIAQTVDDNKQD